MIAPDRDTLLATVVEQISVLPGLLVCRHFAAPARSSTHTRGPGWYSRAAHHRVERAWDFRRGAATIRGMVAAGPISN